MEEYNMPNSKSMSIEEFVEKILIKEIGEIKDKHPYLACMLISSGIEFLGTTLYPMNGKEDENLNSKKKFRYALKKFFPLQKYAEINLYQRIKCGFCDAMINNEDNIVLSNIAAQKLDTNNKNDKITVNVNELYSNFKEACEELLKMKGSSFEIRKILSTSFLEIETKDGVATSDTTIINCIYY